ncbi:MAG TPA: translation initiation factor IF-2 [Myxococcales bacterium]|jgi:translation initiation factor IF-2
MAKKRVHEIAKELKAHGIEMDNKELVAELQSFDFDVKSHSSSLDEDQANVAVEKIVQKHKPKPAPAPVSAAGFVVRRKRPDMPAPAVEAPAHPEPAQQQPSGEPVAMPAEPEPAAATAAVAQHPEPQAEQPAAPTPPAQPEPAVAAQAHPVEPQPVQQQPMAATPAEPPVAKPVEPPPAAPAPAAPMLPRMVAREVAAGELNRAPRPIRPASAGPIAPGARPAQPSVDPRTLRPTASQAVVISRPLIPVRRVTPPSDAHKQVPLAPGPRAIGEVREFKVGTDFLGRREFTDVTKDHAAKKRGKQEIKETLSKQELVDLSRGRVTLPVRAGKKRKPTKKGAKTQITEMAEEKKVIKLEEGITVSELSQTLGVKASELIKKLMASGNMVTVNSTVGADIVATLATDYGWRVEKKGFEIEDYIPEEETKTENLAHRPPVVTIMGHVDHGKTSLLDAIRSADVAGGEAGGITQHIGAYSVTTAGGKDITFLDTPGHEAFTAMRARGAQVTDIVIIVVAADDGVMPQTKEAINHAKAAEVPIIVAINKMDKQGANPTHVKNQLMEFGLVDENLGGDTIMVPVSAKTKEGLDHLLEMILLQAEVLELKSDPTRPAKCSVVEAKLEKGRGPVATVIVQDGTLKVGDAIVTGIQSGRVRAMVDDKGVKIDAVPPGYPAEVVGLSGVPVAGDDFYVVEDENAAKEVAEHRAQKNREKDQTKTSKVKLEDLFAKVKSGEAKELRVIVKADVQGSAEAVSEALKKLSGPKVKVSVIHGGVGGINETDVILAGASNAMIIGFNVRPESKAADAAVQAGVEIRMYRIIYEALDDVLKAMEGLLEPIRREKAIGRAEVRNIFTVPKLGTIAGCSVVDGKIARSAIVRLMRNSKQVYQGKIGSLKRFKDDVREVQSGFECGLSIENFADIKQGDVIEAFEIEEIRPSLQ